MGTFLGLENPYHILEAGYAPVRGPRLVTAARRADSPAREVARLVGEIGEHVTYPTTQLDGAEFRRVHKRLHREGLAARVRAFSRAMASAIVLGLIRGSAAIFVRAFILRSVSDRGSVPDPKPS